MKQRSVGSDAITEGMDSLEIIESYPDDKYLPSFLLRFEFAGRVFHTQIATDVANVNIRVVTVYIPNIQEWDYGLRIRRTNQ